MKTSPLPVWVVGLLVLLLAGGPAFSQENEGSTAGTKVSTGTCLSGVQWTRGDAGSPEMHPGRSCIECHAKGEGPRFLVAGTVYGALAEKDDCYGVAGVTITLTDAKGNVVKMTSNASGNFFLRERGNAIVFPFTAVLTLNGKKRAMATPQSTANCLLCHTAKGANGAPGRIIAPGA